MNTTIVYREEGFRNLKNGNGGNGKNGKEKNTVFPSSGIFCPICHMSVAVGDPYGEFIFDGNGKPIRGWHTHCVKEAAVLQYKIQDIVEQPSL
jgi:hypothetical protein